MLGRMALFGLLAVGFGGGGCSSMGGGMPAGQAQVVVTGVAEPQIETKTEDVFFRHGFDFKGVADGRMEFERPGGVTNDIIYGNWQENDITIKVSVFIIPKGTMRYALRARSVAVRHSFGADSDTESFDIQGGRYGVILKKIAKELAEEAAPAPAR